MTQKDGDFIQITEADMPPITIDNSELPPLPQQETLLTFLRRLFADVRQTASERPIERANLIENVERVLSVDDIQWSETDTPYSVEELFGQEDQNLGTDALEINILTDEENTFALRLAVSAQNNKETAVWYFQRLRQVAQTLPVFIQNNVKDSSQFFGGSDLAELAHRWNIPLVVKQQGRHWFLMLSSPQQIDGAWKFLAYNPYQDEEVWMDLPDYESGKTDLTKYLHEQTIFANADGLKGLQESSYDLALPIDIELANSAELTRAKRANLQPRIDAQNCGPACLLMAAIRAGLHDDNSLFIDVGKQLMEADLSTTDEPFHILSKDEIIQQLRPSENPGIFIE